MHSNEDVLLPTRDFLRQLIGQTKVKPKDIAYVLRSRGVFTGTDQKDITGPILIKTGLSPYEYIELRESYKTKEESPKSITRTISWNSDTNLLDAIPVVDYEDLLNDQFGVFSVSRMSGFTGLDENPDHIYMEFEIERKDSVKNWGKMLLSMRGEWKYGKEMMVNH